MTTKEYYAEHREELRRKAKEYRNSGHGKMVLERYRNKLENKIRKKIWEREYDKSDKVREKKRIYRQREAYRDYSRHHARKSTLKLRMDMVDILGSICKRCGLDDIRTLEIEHINGNGAEERKRFGSSHGIWTYYRRHPEEAILNLQLLCGNCHNIKCYEDRWNK